eukprot:11161264-Lingulodinium_polyedra.AAC.1
MPYLLSHDKAVALSECALHSAASEASTRPCVDRSRLSSTVKSQVAIGRLRLMAEAGMRVPSVRASKPSRFLACSHSRPHGFAVTKYACAVTGR